MRIYLVGFMGAGKTTTGELLAQWLAVPFLDLDAEVESRSGRTVAQLFARQGEEAFRELESEALAGSAATADAVVATGGGILERRRNRSFIRRHGTSVWLRPSFATLLERARRAPSSQRPLFADETAFEELYRRRLEQYRLADLEIRIAPDERPERTVETVLRRLEEQPCAI